MDDLTRSLATNWTVSNRPNTTDAQHPRYTLYKVKSNTPDQLERRRRFLEAQKKRRFDAVAHIRNIGADSWEKEDGGEDEEDMEMEGVAKPGRHYQNQLMLSEWLMEVPEDLPEEWLMVPCPIGRRSLIVCSGGTTYHYTKGGYCMNKFPSLLPGGSRKGKAGRECTILDCLYSEIDRTYYILDVMCWNGLPVYDSETEFRFYWIHTKCQEVPDISEISRINPYKFSPLPSFPCTKHVMTSCMAMPLRFELDGVLFYHKRTHYTFGSTPLVVWLKPFMLPDVLDVPVPKEMMDKRPYNYTSYVHHLQAVRQENQLRSYEKSARKSPGRRKGKKKSMGEGEMEVAEGAKEDAGVVKMEATVIETSPEEAEEVKEIGAIVVTPEVAEPDAGDMEVSEVTEVPNGDQKTEGPDAKPKQKNKNKNRNKKKK
ncbi:snurportin-1-like [Lineus longissimus]|uniref:snurportin-1-like n=1 Tax=Lineus longissimus TaxID=88925 RepID=UPI002B4DD03F